MPPKDPTPHGGEAFHELPDRAKIPKPKPDNNAGGTPRPDEREIRERPPLPEGSAILAADIEDEDADPVKDSGPGIDDEGREPSVTQQPVR